MSMIRSQGLVACGIVAALLVTLAPTSAATGAGAITDSRGTAAAVGIVTRIPAEIVGGILYTETTVNLDKARARSAGLYPGYLADTFLRSSAEEYGPLADEGEAVAENPSSRTSEQAPAGGGDPGTTPLHAETPTTKEAFARAGGPASTGELIEYASATSSSHSRVRDDGTAVTESLATLSSVRIADVVTIGTIESRASVTTPVGAEPEAVLQTNIQHVLVAGIPATLDQEGLALDETGVVTSDEVAQFNAVIAALAEHGVTIEAVPTHGEAELGRGAVNGAAVRVRYQAKKKEPVAEVLDANPVYEVAPLPEELGYDEEFLLAQVTAASLSRPRDGLEHELDLGLSDPDPATTPATGSGDLGLGGVPDEPAVHTENSPAASRSSVLSTQGATNPAAPRVAPQEDVGSSEGTSSKPPTELSLMASPMAPDPLTGHMATVLRLFLVLGVAGAAAPSVVRRLGRA